MTISFAWAFVFALQTAAILAAAVVVLVFWMCGRVQFRRFLRYLKWDRGYSLGECPCCGTSWIERPYYQTGLAGGSGGFESRPPRELPTRRERP